MKLLTTIAGVFLALVSLSGCATTSSLASLEIEGLKGVEFGQSEQEVKAQVPAFQLTPGQVAGKHKTYACDGLTASYAGVRFAPSFIFSDDKLATVGGTIIDLQQSSIATLQKTLGEKMGAPKIRPNDEQWHNGGVNVFLLSREGNVGGAYNYIEFGEPNSPCSAAFSMRPDQSR